MDLENIGMKNESMDVIFMSSCRYPRFILHSLQKDTALTHSIPTLPSHKSLSLSHQYKDAYYVNNTPHPSKAHTPTIRRVSSTHTRLKPNPASHSRAQSTPLLLQNECDLQPLKAKPPRVNVSNKSVPLSDLASTTRLLWSRDSVRDRVDSSNLFSKLAKYNTYPVIPSRRTSVMVRSIDGWMDDEVSSSEEVFLATEHTRYVTTSLSY